MFHTVANLIRERRDAALRTAAYAAAAYVTWGQVMTKTKEISDAQIIQNFAEDSLRRRFNQSQQDVSFTVMALLPNLGRNVLDGMNVEAVTTELQDMIKAAKTSSSTESQTAPVPVPPSPTPSLPPSSDSDIRSDNGSISIGSYSVQGDGVSTSDLGASTTSWVENMSSSQGSQSLHSPQSSTSGQEPTPGSPPESNAPTDLSESFISSSSVSYGDVAPGPSQPTVPTFTRSKAELWKEVKMLTFTRTLTTVYSMTLLSMLAHIQVNILGRMKYVQSVVHLAQQERTREIRRDSLSPLNFVLGLDVEANYRPEDIYTIPSVDEETERKYLTLSWWLLHVGWKDVGERVRRAVEEVFDEVPLKTKTSASDLRRLLYDVRRRVDYEITFEGHERRISFASTLLPPTPETLRHTLTQGGIPLRDALTSDPTFDGLVAETRQHVVSGSLDRVLEVCLDKASEILFRRVENDIFDTAAGGEWEDPNSVVGLVQEPRVRLAGMLPPLAKWCHSAFEGLPNEIVDGLGALDEVRALAAIVYTNYDDRFQ